MKQSYVRQLIGELRKLAHHPDHHLGLGDIRVTQGMLDSLEETAEIMHKHEIMEAYDTGYCFGSQRDACMTAKEYYAETFDGK